VEILPGEGIELVRVGERRADVEAHLGPARVERDGRAFYDELNPAVVVVYDASDIVELVEIPYSGTPGLEVTISGIQLTYRPMDDVLRDLTAAGFRSRESDIGHDFAEGFAIWSMGSLWLSDIDPAAATDDDRQVVEGVSVGVPAFFGF
jgi:hypothetical protein